MSKKNEHQITESTKVDQNEEESITIPLSFGLATVKYSELIKYSKYVENKYQKDEIMPKLSEELLDIEEDFDIKEENVLIFFDFINTGQVNVKQDNYIDLYKLSEAFEVKSLSEKLEEYSSNQNQINVKEKVDF